MNKIILIIVILIMVLVAVFVSVVAYAQKNSVDNSIEEEFKNEDIKEKTIEEPAIVNNDIKQEIIIENQATEPNPKQIEQIPKEQPRETLTKKSGVFFFNGVKETYYSSKALYHYLTPTWTLDQEGFYRDSAGYYVVSTNASDHAYGEVFETSKGLAKRYDTGCASGVVDFYVNW